MKAYVICGTESERFLHQLRLEGFFEELQDIGLSIFSKASELPLTADQHDWLSSNGLEKIFESCYFSQSLKGELRSHAVKQLYSVLESNEYKSGIQRNINIGCYEHLLKGVISDRLTEPLRALDVGCGPGTVTHTTLIDRCESILGYDFSQQCRSAARDKGLEVLDELNLFEKDSTFNLLISCYVLHYESISDATLYRLVNLLEIGGIWAANFHKDRGIEWFIRTISVFAQFEFKQETTEYGLVCFAKKVEEVDLGLFEVLHHRSSEYMRFGLNSVLFQDGVKLVTSTQLDRVKALENQAKKSILRDSASHHLFPLRNAFRLGECTELSFNLSEEDVRNLPEGMLSQLLPYWIEKVDDCGRAADALFECQIGDLHVSTKSKKLQKRVRSARKRGDTFRKSRMWSFSRSASYMGSKSSIAPSLVEILKTFISKDVLVFDLMCGSGAASGAFSHHWKTIASDAQQFSVCLAIVQGGGYSESRATEVANTVLRVAKKHFNEMPYFIHEGVGQEKHFLYAEFDDDTLERYADWVSEYPRIGNNYYVRTQINDEIQLRRECGEMYSNILFSTYYANLFYGVRQAAEIDALRYSIDQLDNQLDRYWALGALVSAVSSSGYTYGNHFAQPRIGDGSKEKVLSHAKNMMSKFGVSISHEFFLRLQSLGAESENAKHPVEYVEGPWKSAIQRVKDKYPERPICVYLDPPYTRDEYSRYYHVLETLITYHYPEVSGNSSIPKRGDLSRFASEFLTRSQDESNKHILQIIEECLSRGWSCLWNYSTTGLASVFTVMNEVSRSGASVDVFSMDYVHKGQGRHKDKQVKEYAIMIRP